MTAVIILNDKEVRSGLLNQGINIPDETHFIACLHDTTTDEVYVKGETNLPSVHKETFETIEASLRQASAAARRERALQFNLSQNDIDSSIIKRGNDWSQIRPEWGLAGCNSFVIAPRNRTLGIDLNGQSFLHSYDWKKDSAFQILESILTAPMVVTSWINLQYFASATDNKHFGSGNKTLHNVTGGFGVIEGSSGDLRIGLPLQSVHNGKEFQHLPQRLNVIIEAPIDAINTILEKHQNIKNLCDNFWITLLQIDEDGKIKQRYLGNSTWEELDIKTSQENHNQLVNI